jgi:hypothetical protein
MTPDMLTVAMEIDPLSGFLAVLAAILAEFTAFRDQAFAGRMRALLLSSHRQHSLRSPPVISIRHLNTPHEARQPFTND